MADVNRIPGPSGPQDASRKDRSVADAQKFRELMKSGKVGEVDADQKKQRKRKDEAEAEAEADTQATLAQQPETTSKAAPFTPEKGAGKIGALKAGAQAPAAPSGPSPLAASAPESASSEEDSFTKNLPPAAPREQAPAPSTAKTSEIGPPPGTAEESDQVALEPKQKAADAATKASLRTEEAKAHKVEKGIKFQEIKEEKIELKETEKAIKGETIDRKDQKEALMQERGEQQEEAQPLPAGPLIAGTAAEKKQGREEKRVEEVAASGGVQPTSQEALPAAIQPTTPTAPASYAYLHPQVLDLFERMVGVMTVMSNAGITETTVTLSSPQYQNSVFFGAQIIIKEYETAQKSYNIQLIGSPQGVALFDANVDDLMAAFQGAQGGRYNFRVNRIETAIASEKPLFHRKEAVGKDKKQQDSGNQ